MSELGTLLAGRYRLERQLGSGGMGIVWLATDERLKRQVAVKELHASLFADPASAEDARQRAMREGRLAGRLNHPNTIAVHDVIEHDGLPALVMEYLPSRSLTEIIIDEGPLDPRTVANIGAQAAAALAAAHAVGIVHRDIKPGNVLIGEDGTVKITDFGISHAADDIAVTKTGVLSGTPAFLSPEVANGHAPASASDVFSLGSTLYTAVEGEPPFGDDAENSIALLHQVAKGVIRPPRSAGVITAVLNRMLEADPARRPTAEQAKEALAAVAAGQPLREEFDYTRPMAAVTADTTAVIPAAQDHGTKLDNRPAPQRRRKLPIIAGAAAALVLLAGILAASLLTGGGNQQANRTASAAEMERVVSDYYALLPAHPENAWSRLGPQMQAAAGRDQYLANWRSISAVSVFSPPVATGRNTVEVGVELTLPDGTRIRETHRLGMLVDRGAPLINTDGVLSSETITPPPPPPPVVSPPDDNKPPGPGKPDDHPGPGKAGDHKGKHGG